MSEAVTSVCRICKALRGRPVEDGQRVVEIRPDREHVVTPSW